MADRRANALTSPPIEALLDEVSSKFTLVTLAALRAREINEYYNQLGEGLGRIVPPQVTSVSRKPLSIALEEVEAGKIVAVENETEEDIARQAAEAAEAAEAAAADADGEGDAPGLTVVGDAESAEDGAGA